VPQDCQISVFIICLNEERVIESCLKQAAKLAAEIIIVDSGSSDRTLDVVHNYTNKIYHQDWLGYGAQKNVALSYCTNDWVLSLDADEVLTDELIEEIKTLDLEAPGYQLARKLYIGDKFIRWGGFYPDYQLRLFKKSSGRFCNSKVHESVELLDHKTQSYSKSRHVCPQLTHALNHYAYTSISEMDEAFMKFAKLSNKKSNLFIAFFNAIYSFINKFIVRQGFLDGTLGLHLAWINTKYSFLKYRNYL
jgi:glycosyltransferase involved in cell wall biosynthesis